MATTLKIDEIQSNFDHILKITGEDSYVNWEGFTKSSTSFLKTLEELAKNIAILRQIQQKKFIGTMKKLKSSDIPDLIKTVKSKKLPKEALKAIIPRLQKTVQGQVELTTPAEQLRKQSKTICDEYIAANEQASKRAKETVDFLTEKIKNSGFYEEPEPAKQLVSTFKHSFPEQKLVQAAKKVQVKYLPNTVNTIHVTTYTQLVQNSYEVIKEEYCRLTEQSRKKQRQIRKNTEPYLKALTEYLTNTEVLVLQGQKALAKKAGLADGKLEEIENVLMDRGLGQNVLYIQSTLRTKVKQSMVSTKEVKLERARKILKQQIGLLSSQVQYFKQLFSFLQKDEINFQMVPMILALALNDMIYQQYQLEQEDIMKQVTDQLIMKDAQFAQLFKELEFAIIKLMEEIKLIPEHLSQYMQQQGANVPGVQGGNQNLPGMQGGAMTGMLPGSNPMELLQLQQIMQMQQMQQQQQQQQQQQGNKK